MRRTGISWVAALAVALFAASANAATNITLWADPTAQAVGNSLIITLRTYATANGGETDNTLFGAIQYSDALMDANQAGNSQTPLLSTLGVLTCTTAFCVAFSQVNVTGPIAVNLTNALIATTTFAIPLFGSGVTTPRVFSFAWRTTPSTQRVDWFGLTNAPGLTLTVVGTSVFVPEPNTAALLGVGLLGLAVAHRRRA